MARAQAALKDGNALEIDVDGWLQMLPESGVGHSRLVQTW
jgi:hypothetical protein